MNHQKHQAVRSRVERDLALQYKTQQQQELDILTATWSKEMHKKSATSGGPLERSDEERGASESVRPSRSSSNPLKKKKKIVIENVLKAYCGGNQQEGVDERELNALRTALTKRDRLPHQQTYRGAGYRSQSCPTGPSRGRKPNFGNDFGSRLHYNAVESKEEKKKWVEEEQQTKRVREFVQAGCTFTPQVSEYANAINRPRSLSPSQRLHIEAALAERKRLLLEHRREAQGLEECTFHPTISTASERIARQVHRDLGEGIIPHYDRLHQEGIDRSNRLAQYAAVKEYNGGKSPHKMTQKEIEEVVGRLMSWRDEKDLAVEYITSKRMIDEAEENQRLLGISTKTREYAKQYVEASKLPTNVFDRLWVQQNQHYSNSVNLNGSSPTSNNKPQIPLESQQLAEQTWTMRLRALYDGLRTTPDESHEGGTTSQNENDFYFIIPSCPVDIKHALLHDVVPILESYSKQTGHRVRDFIAFREVLTAYRQMNGPQPWMYRKGSSSAQAIFDTEMTFKPTLNPISESIANTKKMAAGEYCDTTTKGVGVPVLLTQGASVRSHRRMEDLRRNLDQKEMENCTFRPKTVWRDFQEAKKKNVVEQPHLHHAHQPSVVGVGSAPNKYYSQVRQNLKPNIVTITTIMVKVNIFPPQRRNTSRNKITFPLTC
eukprot:PhF_6_TR36469/c0_g1_i3/m.53511